MTEQDYKPFTFSLADAIERDEEQAEKHFAKVIAGLKTNEEEAK